MSEITTFARIPDELIRWEPSEHPVVTCYVDWRVTGRGAHEATTVVRKGLHDAAQLLEARGPARDSFESDAARIEAHLVGDVDTAARGVAIMACSGRELWRTAELGVPVPTQVHVGERPLLLPLLEATQDATRTLIALVDSRSLRLIELDLTGIHEEPAPRRGRAETSRHVAAGGWSQANFQRSRDVAVDRFAHQASTALTEAVERLGVQHVIVGADEVMAGPLRDALPAHVRERVDAVEHIDIHAEPHELAERVWPEAAAAAAAARATAVAELASRAEGNARATGDPAEIRELLAAGRVDTLAIDPSRLDVEAAELLARETLAHRSQLLIDRDSAALANLGGVAASLR